MTQTLLPIRDVGRRLGRTGKSYGKTAVFKLIRENRLTVARQSG